MTDSGHLSGVAHYRAAEQLLADAELAGDVIGERVAAYPNLDIQQQLAEVTLTLACADVHATLALGAATVLRALGTEAASEARDAWHKAIT